MRTDRGSPLAQALSGAVRLPLGGFLIACMASLLVTLGLAVLALSFGGELGEFSEMALAGTSFGFPVGFILGLEGSVPGEPARLRMSWRRLFRTDEDVWHRFSSAFAGMFVGMCLVGGRT